MTDDELLNKQTRAVRQTVLDYRTQTRHGLGFYGNWRSRGHPNAFRDGLAITPPAFSRICRRAALTPIRSANFAGLLATYFLDQLYCRRLCGIVGGRTDRQDNELILIQEHLSLLPHFNYA